MANEREQRVNTEGTDYYRPTCTAWTHGRSGGQGPHRCEQMDYLYMVRVGKHTERLCRVHLVEFRKVGKRLFDRRPVV